MTCEWLMVAELIFGLQSSGIQFHWGQSMPPLTLSESCPMRDINNTTSVTDAHGSATRWTRREFLRNVGATAAAMLTSACGGGDASSSDSPAGAANEFHGSTSLSVASPPLVWSQIPTITFTQGIPARFSIADFVTDAENDVLNITKNNVALPDGVTYDAATKSFVYDGRGAVGFSGGHVLTATKG